MSFALEFSPSPVISRGLPDVFRMRRYGREAAGRDGHSGFGRQTDHIKRRKG